jgi:hypothetical protein
VPEPARGTPGNMPRLSGSNTWLRGVTCGVPGHCWQRVIVCRVVADAVSDFQPAVRLVVVAQRFEYQCQHHSGRLRQREFGEVGLLRCGVLFMAVSLPGGGWWGQRCRRRVVSLHLNEMSVVKRGGWQFYALPAKVREGL